MTPRVGFPTSQGSTLHRSTFCSRGERDPRWPIVYIHIWDQNFSVFGFLCYNMQNDDRNFQTRFWPLRSGFFSKMRVTITKVNNLSFHLQKTSCQNSNYKSRYGRKREQGRKWTGPGMSGPAIWLADQVRTWIFFLAIWPPIHLHTKFQPSICHSLEDTITLQTLFTKQNNQLSTYSTVPN